MGAVNHAKGFNSADRSRRRRVIKLLWPALLVVLLVLGAGCGSANKGNGGQKATSSATTKAPPTQAPTTQAPTRSPTTSQSQQAEQYVNALEPAMEAEGQALDDFGNTCDPADLQTCRAALKKVHDANANLDKALAANEAPSCLSKADAEIHAAIKLIDQATHTGTTGIDQNDPTLMIKMLEQLDEAVHHVDRADELFRTSIC